MVQPRVFNGPFVGCGISYCSRGTQVYHFKDVPRNNFLSSLPRVSSGLRSRLSSYQVVCAAGVKPSPIYYAGAGILHFSSQSFSLAPSLSILSGVSLYPPFASHFPTTHPDPTCSAFLFSYLFRLTLCTLFLLSCCSNYKLYQRTLTANACNEVLVPRYRAEKPSKKRYRNFRSGTNKTVMIRLFAMQVIILLEKLH